jgi:hypothetical protein
VDNLLLHIASALVQGASVPGPWEVEDLRSIEKLRRGFADNLAEWTLSEDPVGNVIDDLVADHEPDEIEMSATAATDGRMGGRVAYRFEVEPRAELVAGLRALKNRIEELEAIAARDARSKGVTVRQLADATGLSERQVANRYRN